MSPGGHPASHSALDHAVDARDGANQTGERGELRRWARPQPSRVVAPPGGPPQTLELLKLVLTNSTAPEQETRRVVPTVVNGTRTSGAVDSSAPHRRLEEHVEHQKADQDEVRARAKAAGSAYRDDDDGEGDQAPIAP